MKPALLIGGALVAVAVVAAVVVVIGGGGETSWGNAGAPAAVAAGGAGLPVAHDASLARANPPAASVAPLPGLPADAEFDIWAAPLRSAGLVVTAESAITQGGELVVTGLAIAGPASAQVFRWTAATAVLGGRTGNNVVESTGAQTLTVGALDVSVVGTTSITIERGADGAVTALSIEARSLSLAQGEAVPTLVGQLSLRLVPGQGEGGIAARTAVQFRAADVVLPATETAALGPEIELIVADLGFDGAATSSSWTDILGAVPAPGAIGVTSIEIRWGVLEAIGEGTLGLDPAGRLAGILSFAVADPLTVLDAFHAAEAFDRAALAQFYAALLEELGPDPAAALPLTVDLVDGRAVVRGASRNAGDLVLGGLPPLFAPR